MKGLCSFVLVVLLAVGCSSGQDVSAAEAGVARFRELMAAGQFNQMYAEAADEFRKGVDEPDFVKFVEAVNRKLGPVKNADKIGWNINFHTAGTFVTVGCKTEFEKGTGTEQFVFRIKGGSATLVRYDINSPALIIN